MLTRPKIHVKSAAVEWVGSTATNPLSKQVPPFKLSRHEMADSSRQTRCPHRERRDRADRRTLPCDPGRARARFDSHFSWPEHSRRGFCLGSTLENATETSRGQRGQEIARSTQGTSAG